MTRTEHLLVILSEECAEVAKEVSKALRFGLDDAEPGKPETNREKIASEFNDLFAVMLMLKEEGIFEDKQLLTLEAIKKKKARVERYLLYSQEVGRLD